MLCSRLLILDLHLFVGENTIWKKLLELPLTWVCKRALVSRSLAPEIVRLRNEDMDYPGYGKSVDIWALGVCLYILFVPPSRLLLII